MTDILQKLHGGDLRSISRANEVAKEVVENHHLFEKLFRGLYSNQAVVRMRAADAIEKVTRVHPELLSTHVSEIILLLMTAKQKEICWHMAQIAPRLSMSSVEEKEIISRLKSYLSHESKIVQVSAMESLASFAERNPHVKEDVINTIQAHKENGSPAVKVRARKLLARLTLHSIL